MYNNIINKNIYKNIYNDTIKKRNYINKFVVRIEKILNTKILNTNLLNTKIVNMAGGNKYVKIYDKMYDGNVISDTLLTIYDQVIIFQQKLEELINLLKPNIEKSEFTNQKIKFVVDMRDKYDKIIERLNNILENKFYNQNTNDESLYVKYETSKWENIIDIYINFINNYQKIFDTIHGQDLNNIINIVNKNIIDNLKELNKFTDELILMKSKLEAGLMELNSIKSVEYNKNDIYVDKTGIINIMTIKEKDLYIDALIFDGVTQIIKPGNMDIFENIFKGVISELKIAEHILEPKLPNFDNRAHIGGGPNEIPKTEITTSQKLPNFVEIIQNLNKFGLQLQNTNYLMTNVKKSLDGYTQLKIRANYFMIYIMQIQTSINKRSYVYYKFVNHIIIKYYYDILLDLDNQITIGTQTEIIKYFSVYHYFIIKRLLGFCNFLLSEINNK